jgi:ERCC4-related helicase
MKDALLQHPEFMAELHKLQARLHNDGGPLLRGHPKITKMEEIISQHFALPENANSRVIVFSKVHVNNNGAVVLTKMCIYQFRDSVDDICQILVSHAPSVRAEKFIGQATAGKTAGFAQSKVFSWTFL